MKLNLKREWFENRIAAEDDADVTAGTYNDNRSDATALHRRAGHTEEEFAESLAFSALIRLLRKERGLSVQQLAEYANISVAEVISIEQDRAYRPKHQTISQLSEFFGIAPGAMMKLSNISQVQDETFVSETICFAANAADILNLGEQERQILHKYIRFLGKQDAS